MIMEEKVRMCLCVLQGARDNEKAQRQSRGRGDQVASAVGNEDGEGDWKQIKVC